MDEIPGFLVALQNLASKGDLNVRTTPFVDLNLEDREAPLREAKSVKFPFPGNFVYSQRTGGLTHLDEQNFRCYTEQHRLRMAFEYIPKTERSNKR